VKSVHTSDEFGALTRVDLNLLVVLGTLLAERHVGRAAARLHLTQSAVSHALNRLREIFNDPLFVRIPVGVAPTPRALELADPVSAVLKQVGRILAPGQPFDPRLTTDRLVLGTTDYASVEIMPALVSFIRQHAPGLHLVLRNLRLDNLTADLDAREFDAAIAPISERMPTRFSCISLFDDHIILAARREHPLLEEKLDMLKFRKLRHVLVISSRSENTAAHATLRPYGVGESNVGMVVPHFLAAAFIAAQSDLVMLVPSRLSRYLEVLAGLATDELPASVAGPSGFRMGLVFSRERATTEPALAWLVAAVKQLASRSDAPWRFPTGNARAGRTSHG
jgi:DNA-binding transcriptional LysR family regulator